MTCDVLIITKNREKHLSECLESIVNQTIRPTRVIIVENNFQFTLNTLEKKFTDLLNVSFYFDSSSNLASLRNIALSKAKSEIIMFTDDDCILDKNWIKTTIIHFKQNAKLCCLIGRNLCYQGNFLLAKVEQDIYERWFGQYVNLNCDSKLESGVFFDTKNVALKKAMLDKYQLQFNTNAAFKSEDTEFGLNLFSKLTQNEQMWFSNKMKVYHKNNKTFINFFKKRLIEGKEKKFLEITFPQFEKRLINSSNLGQKNRYPFWNKLLFFLSQQVQRIGYLQATIFYLICPYRH